MVSRRVGLTVGLLLAMGAAGVGQTVKIGDLTVPADCALAKNERPRLLFRGRDLPEYQARIAGPMKGDFERFKKYWDQRIADPAYRWDNIEIPDGVCLGVLYRLTGDTRYAEAVKKQELFKKGSTFWAHAFTLDLIFDTLSAEEVKSQTDLFLKRGEQGYRYQVAWALWPAAALYGGGSGRDAEIARWLKPGAEDSERHVAEVNVWASQRGGDVNSFSYIGNHTVISLPAQVMTLANALGRDTWQECLWTRHIAAYYAYNYYPWREGAIHFDNTTGVVFGPTPHWSGDFGAAYLLAAGPARYHDGLNEWWTERLLDSTGNSQTTMAGLWGRILFYDPAVPALGPENFPPSRFFLTRGMSSMRENWGKDATMVHFRCGAFGGLGDNRHNADNNTFTIYKKGILALDTGAEHSLDAGG